MASSSERPAALPVGDHRGRDRRVAVSAAYPQLLVHLVHVGVLSGDGADDQAGEMIGQASTVRPPTVVHEMAIRA